MVSVDDIQQARESIKDYIKVTPLQAAPSLSELTGASVALKLECKQVTGSFKVRGALNRLMTLSREDAEKGVITASTGNHGLGVAFAAKQLGINAKVVFPIGASTAKRDRMTDAGVEVIQDVGYEDVEPYARKLAKDRGLTYISPYNDPEIIAGAGTSGLEILEQQDEIDAVFVPIGGGGLISGIAIAIKYFLPYTMVIGVQSEESPEVHDSWIAGEWVESEEFDSLAQGLMGGVESDSITLDIISDNVDSIILVSEDSIKEAMRFLYEEESLLVEGAGAVTTAALMENASQFEGQKVVLTLSGGNISKEDFFSQIE
ncbi:MAG: threonine/serine dehydratase [Candidatus Thorarchaeota archaeon]|nr:MAG: threonine/serine dehydratase [Candidatus Thorarchaeota archaeon]